MRTDQHHWVAAAVFALALAPIPAAHAAEITDGVVDSRPAPTRAAPPNRADAYLASGQQNLTLGKAGAAAADLEKAVRLKPTNAYNVLWLHFARNKEGAADAVELQINAGRVNRAAWPGPLLDYLTGKIDASAVLAKAGEGEDKARANRMCEAGLFLGQEQMTKGRRSEGLEQLQAAASACDGLSREAQLARASLPGASSTPAAPKPAPILADNRMPKVALLTEPTVRPASIRPAPARPQAQDLAQNQFDPLLRGSLR
jgi:hypothetical protein